MNSVIFVGVLAALVLLFAAGLRIPPGRGGCRRWLSRVVVVGAALSATALAGVALFRHDSHFDVTASKAFTPSDDAERVARGLVTDVEVTYFYQSQDPAGRAARTTLEILDSACAPSIPTVIPEWPAATVCERTMSLSWKAAAAECRWSPPTIVTSRSAFCALREPR
jgi:hypothetical protein